MTMYAEAGVRGPVGGDDVADRVGDEVLGVDAARVGVRLREERRDPRALRADVDDRAADLRERRERMPASSASRRVPARDIRPVSVRMRVFTPVGTACESSGAPLGADAAHELASSCTPTLNGAPGA